MIESAELIFYDENADQIVVDLSPTQLNAVMQVLGLRIEGENMYQLADGRNGLIVGKVTEAATDPDPFYTETNMTRLRNAAADAKAGKNMTEHELIEIDEIDDD